MPKASLSGAEVDALLFGTVQVSSPEEQGVTASGRPWRYPAWPKCDGCGYRDGAVTSCTVKDRAKSRRVWLCEWCLSAFYQEEVSPNA